MPQILPFSKFFVCHGSLTREMMIGRSIHYENKLCNKVTSDQRAEMLLSFRVHHIRAAQHGCSILRSCLCRAERGLQPSKCQWQAPDLSASVSEWTETMRTVLMSSGRPVAMSHSRQAQSACRWLVHHCPKATAACDTQITLTNDKHKLSKYCMH